MRRKIKPVTHQSHSRSRLMELDHVAVKPSRKQETLPLNVILTMLSANQSVTGKTKAKSLKEPRCKCFQSSRENKTSVLRSEVKILEVSVSLRPSAPLRRLCPFIHHLLSLHCLSHSTAHSQVRSLPRSLRGKLKAEEMSEDKMTRGDREREPTHSRNFMEKAYRDPDDPTLLP